MERLPRRTPAAQMDIVGLVFDALADAVEGIPIIGDIVGFVASLFGNSSASNARIARLETIVSKGSSGYDDFNRADTSSSLGRGPQMPADWVQGGNGENLRITGRAARLVEGSIAPSQGRRWARYPTPASSSTMTADTICDDKNIDTSACTTLIVCANEAFTEGIYANVFGTGVYLGKFTRSGTSWVFNDFPSGSNAVYKIGTAERIELRASGSGLYQLVVENSVVVEAEDTVFPIDAAHRYCGFAIQMTIPFPFNYQYGWGLSAFSMKSEAGTFTAIESVETVANGAVTVANGAQAAADNAVGTAVTQATAAANAAVAVVQKEVIQKFAVFDIKSPTPGYVAINGTEWPSIPHSDLKMLADNVKIPRHRHKENNQTGSFAYTDYDPSVGTNDVDVQMTRLPEKLLPANQQWFAFIRVPVDTALSGLNFYARGTPTELYTRVYSMSPTGDMAALTPTSPNLASLLTNAEHISTPTNFEDAIVEAGTWVAVRFWAVGTVYLAGTENFTPERPSGFYPRQISATTAISSASAAPDTIAESDVTWPVYPSGFVVYVAVGNNIVVAQPKRFWDDNFDREDAGGLFGIGGSWSTSLNVGIRSNDLAFISSSDGLGYAIYTKPLTTDYQLHGCRVGLLPDAGQSQVAFAALLFRCTQNRSTGLRVAFRRGAIILQSIANQTTFTNLVSTSRTLALTDSIQAQQGEWVDDVFYPDRVLVFHNGVEIIRTDVTNATVPYGPQRRYGGLGQERTPFQNSPRIQDWFEGDISDVETP